MSKLYSVTAYSGTGFDALNIPDSPNTLAKSGTAVTYPSIYIRQPWGRTAFKLNSTWANVRDIDYVTITDPDTGGVSCYTVDGISMESENTAVIAVSMDYINTAGGISQISILDGWAMRKHVSKDNDLLFGNIIPEPWSPSNALVLDGGGPVEAVGGVDTDVDIVGATIAIDGDFGKALSYTDGENVVTAPVTPLPSNRPTNFVTRFGAAVVTNTIPELYAYNLNGEGITDGINNARSLGLEQAVVASYTIPANYISSSPDYYPANPAQIRQIIASRSVVDENSPDYEYVSTVRNKKVFSLYNNYRLSSVATGNYSEFGAADIYNTGDSKPGFVVLADLAPGGHPYARPQYYHGQAATSPATFAMASVQGAQWLNTPITFSGASGAAWSTSAYNRQYSSIFDQSVYAAQSAGLAGVTSLLNFLPGVSTQSSKDEQKVTHYQNEYDMPSIGSIAGGISGPISAGLAINQIEKTGVRAAEAAAADYNKSTGVVVPQINFPAGNNLQNYTGNNFWVSRTRLSENDAARFDDYLDRYGYAVDEKLTIDAFSTRSKFNYVEATSVSVDSTTGGLPLRLRNAIASQIESGIRVWHVKPSPGAFSTNT